jgi:putative DNA-invertase from lambdoid prophage Rac
MWEQALENLNPESELTSTYVYMNRPRQSGLPEEDLREIDRAGYALDLGRLIVEHEAAYRPAVERPQLQRLLRRVAPGDEVVVTHLFCLGNSVRDVLSTIEQFRSTGAQLRCLETGPPDLAWQPEPQAIKALHAACRLDTLARQARSEASIERARGSGTEPGRPPTFSKREQARIMQSLARGTSVTDVARAFGTSRQTILRIRTAHRP